MQQFVLKKVLSIGKVESKDWVDYLSNKNSIRNLYWLFNVGAVSLNEIPIGWRFFDSLEELNQELGKEFTEKDVKDFDEMLNQKKKDREKWLKDIWYYD